MVGLFRRAWKEQLASAVLCDDEVPDAIGSTGERLVRVYMQRVAPKIWPARDVVARHQPRLGRLRDVAVKAAPERQGRI